MWKINNNNDYIKASNSPDCKLSLKRFSKGSCSVKARLAVRPLRTSKPSQNDITFYTSMNTIFFLFFYELMLSNIFHAKMVGMILWHHSPGNSHSMTDLSAYLLDKAVVSSKRIFLFIFDLCHLFLLGFLSSVYDWWNAFFWLPHSEFKYLCNIINEMIIMIKPKIQIKNKWKWESTCSADDILST